MTKTEFLKSLAENKMLANNGIVGTMTEAELQAALADINAIRRSITDELVKPKIDIIRIPAGDNYAEVQLEDGVPTGLNIHI